LVLLAVPPAPEPGSASDYPEEVRPLHSAAVENLRNKLEQEFRQQLDPDAVAMADELGCAAWALAGSNNEHAHKALRTAVEKVEAIRTRHPDRERIMLAVVLKTVDEAPADAAEIGKISDEARRLLNREMIFPARAALDRLASEIRISTSDISLQEADELIRKTLKDLEDPQSDAAARRLSAWRSLIRQNDYVAPLAVGNALAALDAAEQAGSNRAKLLESLAAAEACVNRAADLGYIDPQASQPSISGRFTRLREAIARDHGIARDLGELRETLERTRLLCVSTTPR
jgi:hypothetical protein